MESNPQHDRVSAEALKLGYQPDATPARGLLVFVLASVVVLAGVLAVVRWLMNSIESHDAARDVPRSVVPVQTQLPPDPRLQPSPEHNAMDYQDLARLHEREDEIFTKIGWSKQPGATSFDIPPAIVRQVADEQRTRAAAAFVPPTTTGRAGNSISLATTRPSELQSGQTGGGPP
jgi:hypothetical protein